MSGNESFDRTLETWLRRQAPREAPDRVLDAALERVQVEPQRRGWLERVFGGTTMTNMIRTAAAAVVIAIAGVVGLQLVNPPDDIGPSPIPSPSAAPSESTAPSPTASGEPSAAALVVQLLGGGEAGPVHLVTVLDDGRLITSDPNGVAAPMERRLTPAGIQLVRDEMAATGLTDTSANYGPVANPGVEPPGFGGAGPRLEVGQPGGDPVVINWYLFADTEQDFFQPQPEAETLEALLVRLTTMEAWLPTAAWTDANAVPHVPDGYRMTISSSPWGLSVDDLPADVATVAWPLDVDMANFGELLNPAPDEIRCGLVDGQEGTAVIESLQAAGATPQVGTYLSFGLGARGPNRHVTITLAPILPFDESSC